MYQYRIGSNLTPLSGKPEPDTCVLTLLSSEELDQNLQLPGLEQVLRHTRLQRGMPAYVRLNPTGIICAGLL